ncbi:hypothetical protein EK21DRAFT_84477 [Setomelanomma holmii]|uniref:Uncharacterized protein n=1 Tax=Setomelanomma holmii TaxID=210430 RepID=A0A9P4HLZ2_9PLEO|nr:hypothetical protein EK21DRAFT_84477 [Setomelanomma holmii]
MLRGKDHRFYNGIPLWMLLKFYCICGIRATNACDYLYGILGLACDAGTLGMRPSYVLKDNVSLVFARMTRAIIAKGEGEILTMVQFPKSRSDLPSWVPDLTNAPRRSCIDRPLDDSLGLFCANEKTEVELLDVSNELIFGITGFLVDIIEGVANAWRDKEQVVEIGRPLETERDGETTMEWDHACDTASHMSIKWTPDPHAAYLECFASVEAFCRLSEEKGNPIYPSSRRSAEAH